MIFIGIDPGLDGAVAIDPPTGLCVVDTPTTEIKSGKKTRRIYLPSEMVALLQKHVTPMHPTHTVVFIEDVHAMPGQGVRSMFSMGFGAGLWQGICAALRVHYELVTPQRWKKALMDGMGKDKDASRIVAQRMFPSMVEQLKRKKDHGRADALLIAEYGRRTWTAPG